MNLSALLICAFCAARCACRSLLTRCSGVSPGMRGTLGATADPPVAVLEVAWGMVDVKRVASLTLLGPILEAIAAGQRQLRGGRSVCEAGSNLNGFRRRGVPEAVRDGWKWCHEIFRARCVGHELRVCDWCGVASGERRVSVVGD